MPVSQRISRTVSEPTPAPPARRTRIAAQDRRDLILVAAARRFAEFGFEATTVRQLADDVNILSGSLYHHFATKEDILDAIVRQPALDQRDRALRIAALPVDAETRAVTLLEADLVAFTERQEAYAIIFAERKFFRRSDQFHFVTLARRDAFEAWRTILRDGAEAGQFRADVDPYLTISTIMRMLNTGADWYRNEDGSPIDVMKSYSLEELGNFYKGFVLSSIRAPGRAGEPMPQAAAFD